MCYADGTLSTEKAFLVINGNGLFVSDSCFVMDSKESSQEGEKEKSGEEMETESEPEDAHIAEIKEQRDNRAVTSDEGKQEQVSDSVKNNEADKENSEGKVDAKVVKVEEVVSTEEISMEEENVDMNQIDEADRLELSESKHEAPKLSKEVPETSEPREVSETPEEAKELATEEEHLSESMKRSEHTPESLESDSQIPEEIKSGQDAPDTTERREEASSEKPLATAEPGNQVLESTKPVDVIKETTNADKLQTETTRPIDQVTETTEHSEPVDNAELKPETIDSSDLKSEANEPGGKGPDASDPDVPRTIHSGEMIPATIDTGESTLERIYAGDEVPKTIDPCESVTEPGQQVQERAESEEREMDIIVQAGAETGEEMISSETQQMEVKSLEQEPEQNDAERETSDPVDSKTESIELTAGEPEDQLKRSTVAEQTDQGIAETCQEIQQSTSEDKTNVEIETSKLSERSEHKMTTHQNEEVEQMQIEKQHKEIDQENKSADQVEIEMQQKEQSIEMQDMDVGDKVMTVSEEEYLAEVLAKEINLDQAVEPSESRSEVHNLAVEESEAKKMESQCLDKDNNRDEPEVKNKQALELTDVLEYSQHTDSLHMMKTRENVKEISQAETSDGSLDDAGKKETGDFEEKLEELQSQSQSWVEFPDHREEGVSEIFEQEKESTECQEIKIQDRMEIDTQAKDKIFVPSDIEKIDTGDKVQLDEIQLGACDGKDVHSEEEIYEENPTEQDEKQPTEEGKPY